jgi:DNA polymerase I-like protein with 3'-5' exonuclease and polymerase domains
VIADYSQIELRVAASIAGEEKMIAAYERGEDLHVLTAAAILDKPAAEVDKEDRQIAKSANFGLLYGQGAKGLVSFASQSYGVNLTTPQALGIRTRFFSAYPALARWHADCSKLAAAKAPEVRTALGRRRLISSGADRWQRFTALINAPVQGGAADGLKRAMVDLARDLPPGARIVSTIHDELLLECEESLAANVAELVRHTMTSAMQKLFPAVPIHVDVSVAKNWGK